MEFFKDTWYLYLRLLSDSVRMPVFLFLAILQPVLWMLLFGQLFGAVTQLEGFETDSYIQFLTPGIAIMTALFSAAYSGMGLLRDIDAGILDRLLATPIRRGAIIAARVLLAASQVILQATLILFMGFLLGARAGGGFLGLFCVLLAAATLASSFASMSNALALMTRRQEMVIAAMNFLVLPMTFLSSMIMSTQVMPPWIRTVSLYNPVNWAVTASRNGFQGVLNTELLTSLGLLLSFSLLCSFFAARAFARYQRSA